MEECTCPYCDQILVEVNKAADLCCSDQDIATINGINTCINCGLAHGYDYVTEYFNFYENLHRIRWKSVYNRKYHIQNVLDSAAQICPNQNIRVMRVGPIRVYAYAYTHIRVCIYAHTCIQYIRVCLIGMYELTYCFFLFLQVIVIFNGLTACHRARKSFLYFDKQAT